MWHDHASDKVEWLGVLVFDWVWLRLLVINMHRLGTELAGHSIKLLVAFM